MQPVDGVAWYRLVQTGASGDIRFVEVKTVSRSQQPVNFFTVFPNPVQGLLSIRLHAAGSDKVLTEVFDMTGRRFISQNFAVMAGEQVLTLDMSRLKSGSYILKITANGETRSQLVNKF